MKTRHATTLAAFALIGLAGASFPTHADDKSGSSQEGTGTSSREIVVSSSSLKGWVFSSDGAPMGLADFVTGPGTAPLGSGSLLLTLANATERVVLSHGAYAGTRLDALTAIGFSCYPVSGTGSPTLQLDIDFDLTDTTNSWQGALVYDPALNGTLTPGAWQPWDALAGKWYMTAPAISANLPAGQPFPLATPGTLAEILLQFPNAGIRATTGAVSLKSGGPSGALSVNVDAIVLDAAGADPVTYNFEPDSDGDGVPDAEDKCSPSDTRPFVDVGAGPTTILNSVDDNGCTIQDLVLKQQAAAKNHGKYVSAIAKLGNDLKKAGTITSIQSKELKTGAAQSSIGMPAASSGNSGTGSANSGSGSSGSGNSNSGNSGKGKGKDKEKDD